MPTENGWEPWHAGADILEWIEIPGTNPPVHIQVQKGQPSAILKAFCADFNAYIEPLRDRDTACFTPTNSVATSNHLNGTAVDLNWDSHPFRVLNAGFDDAKLHRMRDLLAFYTLDGVQMVWWGNDWRNPKDAMHVNMGYNTYNNPATARFIAERIRPDGYSTYKREPVNAPKAPPAVSAVPQAGGEHVLKWDERITAQEQPWDCGPASAQVVLSTRGISKSEGELIRLCGTNTGGTDSIDQIRKAPQWARTQLRDGVAAPRPAHTRPERTILGRFTGRSERRLRDLDELGVPSIESAGGDQRLPLTLQAVRAFHDLPLCDGDGLRRRRSGRVCGRSGCRLQLLDHPGQLRVPDAAERLSTRGGT